MPNAANTSYYHEQVGTFSWICAPHPEGSECYYDPDPRIITGWHGEAFRFNTAFVDGHAQATLMRGYEAPHLGHYPDRADPQQGYCLFQCVIMRGPGWQLDTLPAPIIWTGIPDDYPAATACESRGGNDTHRQDAAATPGATGCESNEPGILRLVVPAEGDFAL